MKFQTILVLFILTLISSCSITGLTTLDKKLEGPYLVTKVVDGDTADIIINGETERLRFSGINTPETAECYYQEAKDKTTDLMLNKEVYLESDYSDRGNYGRLLRYIYLDDETMVNSILVEQGYAKVYDKYQDDTKRYDELKEHEQIAIDNNLGIWACSDKFKDCLFVGSKNSNLFHTPTCKYAKKIKPENKVCYNSKEEAESLGKEFSNC